MKLIQLDSVDSTNDYIKRFLPARENTVVCARTQEKGRGTKGRSFLSNEGGVYLSVLTFYGESAPQAFSVMAHAAVAVCRTARFFGAKPAVKWPNDVLVGGRKLSGILIENGVKGGKVDYSIVGIGLNVTGDLSSLGGIAVTLSEAAGRPLTVEEVREKLVECYGRPSTFEEYLSFVGFLGEKVAVSEGERHYEAVARRILADGRLEIEQNGTLRALSSAEITLRLV